MQSTSFFLQSKRLFCTVFSWLVQFFDAGLVGRAGGCVVVVAGLRGSRPPGGARDLQADAVAEGWLDKFFRLRSRGYVQTDEVPTGLTSQFTVQTTDEAGVSARLEVLTGTDEKGEEGWYARSQHTRELVKLDKRLASETREDLDTVLED